jgi:hypothetical protein
LVFFVAQDDAFEFCGPHLTVPEGFSSLPQALASSLTVQTNSVVQRIDYGPQASAFSYVFFCFYHVLTIVNPHKQTGCARALLDVECRLVGFL